MPCIWGTCNGWVSLRSPWGWSFAHDVMKWKHFQRYWPFVRGIHRSPVNSLHKGQWRGALIFSLICAWINSWVNNRESGDLRRNRDHYDVIVMDTSYLKISQSFEAANCYIYRSQIWQAFWHCCRGACYISNGYDVFFGYWCGALNFIEFFKTLLI